MQNSRRADVVKLTVRFLISAGLMIWLISGIEWNLALRLMKEGSLFYFFIAFIAIQLTVATSIWKWQLLISKSTTNPFNQSISLWKLGRYYYIGLFFNNFLPGSVGGDVMRIMHLSKDIGMVKATTSVAFERLTSGVALTAIVVFATLFMDSVRPFMLPIYTVASGLTLLFVLLNLWVKKQAKIGDFEKSNPERSQKSNITMWINKMNQALVKLRETAAEYREKSKSWWVVIAVLSLLFQIGLAWINQLLFLGFGIEVGWLDLIVMISLISFITMLPVSLNGIGVREASYIFFFKELGVPDEISVAVSLFFLLLVTVSSLFGGLFWLVERGKSSEAIGQQTN
ncbi:flippase-like domain-containing protein [Bacillus sp. DNRA2]|nr:lysylphosphatidylglycerol synthase transmembrane domain-containing protein [Bacillus sp. DNRA2]NMD71363.1 flippase-like domain-containing protein [Bacillus sp. DNRA2]